MKIAEKLFPKNSRTFAGLRWISIALRTLHLIGVAGVGGAFLQHVAPAVWMPYLWITVISGAALLLLESWCDGIFVLQLRGIAILVKILLLAASWYWHLGVTVMIVVISISGIISHAPGKVRYYRLFKRFPLSPVSNS